MVNRKSFFAAYTFALLTTVALTAWQDPPAAPQTQQQPPTFRTRIDSVSVDVIVLDRQGKPVTDLTADDFEIREANKPQKVDTFKFINVADKDLVDPAADRPIVSFEAHRRETGSDENRLLVILLDDYHVRRENSMRVREMIARFVSQLSPRDLVAVAYPLTPPGGLTFSRHHDGTAAAIMKFEGRKYDYTPKNAFEDRYQVQPPELLERMRNELTVRGLESLCVYLGGLREGRKSVLFVSEGLASTLPPGVRVTGNLVIPGRAPSSSSSESFVQSLDLLSQFRMLFVAAARNNTSIYTYDPRGLASSEFDISDRVAAEADRQILNESLDSLRTIADQTDGRAIVSRNDPMPEFRRMVRDGSAYYLLGYTSSIAPRDGKFHEIQVRVKRKDVDVRARKGYWAYTAEDAERASMPAKPSAPRDVIEALESLAEIAEPAARRAFSVWLGAARGPAEKAVVTLAWETSGARAASDAETIDHVTITAQSVQGEVLFKGTVARDPNALRPGGRVTFDAPAGAIRVRVVAESAKGTRIDTEDVGLEVPDFSAPGPTVSTPVVFRGRTARDLQLVKSSATPVPTASRLFSRTERLLLRFDAYGPAGTAPKIEMRLLNRQGDAMAALPAPSAAGTSTFQSELALGPLPPGDYLIEIVATSGTDTTRKLLAIRVTG